MRTEEEFWSNVLKSGSGNDCWIWMAAKNEHGYGLLNWHGHMWKAHRVSYELSRGPIQEGKFILHHCDVPACVRPDHLFIGTQADNIKDMQSKGRMRNQNTNKTHCPSGHIYTKENTRINKGKRYCRICSRINTMRHYYKKRSQKIEIQC